MIAIVVVIGIVDTIVIYYSSYLYWHYSYCDDSSRCQYYSCFYYEHDTIIGIIDISTVLMIITVVTIVTMIVIITISLWLLFLYSV